MEGLDDPKLPAVDRLRPKMSSQQDTEPRNVALSYQYEHIFLPPDAGRGADSKNACFDDGDMATNLLESLREFKGVVDAKPTAVDTCVGSIKHMMSTRLGRQNLDHPATLEAMKGLSNGGKSTALSMNCYHI